MNTTLIASSPAASTSSVGAARMAATTLAGAVVGVVVADLTGMFNAIPVLVGMTLGALARPI